MKYLKKCSFFIISIILCCNFLLLKGKALKTPQKYYVAATRAKYSIAFVVDDFPKKVEWLKRDEIYIGNDKIEALRYFGL